MQSIRDLLSRQQRGGRADGTTVGRKRNKIYSFFRGAWGFVMNNPVMVENMFISDHSSLVLPWLAEHIIAGAEFNSSARDPPPQCHPNTRVEIIATVQGRIHQSNSQRKVMWLYGPAGVGKSAIMQTIAEREAKSQILGATLFFSRPFGRRNPSRVWPTISYRLAVQIPIYQSYVREQMIADPLLLEKNIREQFEKLIIEPFGRRRLMRGDQQLPIFLDGLDECEGEEAQTDLVHLISKFTVDFPEAPLFWIIASRPEQHLKIVFKRKFSKKRLWKVDIPVDSDDACKDVERFMGSSFEEIREKYPHSVPTGSQWPSDNDLMTLARATSGLFVFAAAVIRFIDDPKVGDPVSQLAIIVAIAEKNPFITKGRDPLAVLHFLYTEILELIPTETFPTTKRILGTLVLREQGASTCSRPLPFQLLCNILGLQQNVAYGALHKLHSVLQIPDPGEARTNEIRVFHASFAEYLYNCDKSGKFWIDPLKAASDWWWACFGILQHLPHDFSWYGVGLSWPDHDIDIREELWELMAYGFLHHLAPCPHPSCPFGTHATDFLDSTTLVDVFKDIDFRNLVGVYLNPSNGDGIFAFANWLFFEEHPKLLQAGLLQKSDDWTSLVMQCDDYSWSWRIDHRKGVEGVDPNCKSVRPAWARSRGLAIELKPGSPTYQDRPLRALLVGSPATGRCILLMDDTDEICCTLHIIPLKRIGWVRDAITTASVSS